MSYILFSCYGNLQAEKAATILREEGHTVVITSDGNEALQVITTKNEMPVVMFAHLLMPAMDGSELTAVFRRDYPTSNTRILLSTIKSSMSGPVRFWQAAVESFIMSPYTADQLVLSIEQLLYRDVTMPQTKEPS